ncbi:MAG: PAS domain-containing sensor histidine kinase [Gemmatimonadales bacterium]
MSLLWLLVLPVAGVVLGGAAALLVLRRPASRAGPASPGAGEYFEHLFEHAPVAVVLSDRAGRIRRVNQRFTRLFGYGQAEVAGRSVDDVIVPPELLAEARDATRLAAEGFKEIPATVRRRKDGTLADVSVHCTRVSLAGDGDGGAVYSIYQDIADRVRAEQDGAVAEERFRQLAENIEQVFWLTTPERSELLYVSPAYERIFGRSLEFAYRDPQAFLEAVHPDDRPRVRTSLPGLAQGGWAERYRVVRPDGSVRWVRSRAFPIRNRSGDVYRIAGLTEDITDQKEIEDAVHARERLLELFFSQSLDGFFFMMLDEPVPWDGTVDKERTLDYVFAHDRITKVNDAMLRQYGATREQLVGRTPNELFASDIARARARWRRFFDAGQLHVETDERRLDGTPLRIDGDYICLREEPGAGRIVGHFGVQRDVTARYRAEEELRLSEEQLRELANRLQAVREEERRRIAIEIHDRLGQALTGIKLDLAWLERRLPSGDAALHQRARGTLGHIDAAIESVKRIGAELRPAVLDTLGLLAAIEWQANEFTERTGIGCHLELPPKVPALDDARSTALFRVVQEALTNVARHADAHRVDISLDTRDGHLVLEVADDGKGMGDRQTTGPRALGIAGMRERLGAYGGRLRIAGRQPGGTVLEARVPFMPEANS